MTRSISLCAAIALSACTHGKPVRQRWFEQGNIESCAPLDSQLPVGRFTLWMVTLADGSVPAALVHDSVPQHRAAALGCFATLATALRRAPLTIDTVIPLTLVCEDRANVGATRHRVFCGGIEDAPLRQPLDAALAAGTLVVATWAGAVDRGWAKEYAGMPADAVGEFEAAVASAPNDARAWRGLAQALGESGDLRGARVAAERAVRLEPDSSGSHEALVRACLAAQDDLCVQREAALMIEGRGAKTRSFLQVPLNGPIRAAFDRLNGLDAQPERSAPLAPSLLVEVPDDKAVRHVNVDARGAGGGLPVVFIPGLGGGVHDFAAQLDHAARSRRALAIDLPGQGFSDPPVHYAEALIISDLDAALRAQKVDRFVLVAHGLGATLAVALAVAEPQRVAGLLLVDPLGDLTRANPDEVQRSLDELSSREFPTIFDLYTHRLLDGASLGVRELVLREAHMLPAEAAAKYFELAASFPLLERLRSLRMPVHLVRSSQDDEPFAVGALLPELPQVRSAAGSSWLMLDQPALVNDQLDTLLAAVELR